MPPSKEYLLLEPQPAMKMPITQTEEIAIIYKMPIFRSLGIKFLPNGIATNAMTGGTTAKKGASHHTSLSASLGLISSLTRSFTASAMDCKTPCQPTRMGPNRDWICADTFLSHHIRNI